MPRVDRAARILVALGVGSAFLALATFAQSTGLLHFMAVEMSAILGLMGLLLVAFQKKFLSWALASGPIVEPEAAPIPPPEAVAPAQR
jgi:hypothetical protein